MNRKALLIGMAIASTALLTTTLGLTYARGNISLIPTNAEKTEKSFAFDSTVGGSVWMPGGKWVSNYTQNVSTGIGTPINATLSVPYQKNCKRQAGGGQFFYHESGQNDGVCGFEAGIHNLQRLEINYSILTNAGDSANVQFDIDYIDSKKQTHSVTYNLAALVQGTVYQYVWEKPAELADTTIDKFSATFNYHSVIRFRCHTINVNWYC